MVYLRSNSKTRKSLPSKVKMFEYILTNELFDYDVFVNFRDYDT